MLSFQKSTAFGCRQGAHPSVEDSWTDGICLRLLLLATLREHAHSTLPLFMEMELQVFGLAEVVRR